MFKFSARLAVAVAVAAIAVVPMTASAAGGGGGGGSNGMTITIGSPITLQSRLLVTVPVTVTCVAPIAIDPTLVPPGSIGVTVEQANRNSAVAVATGGVELDSCSPTPQTFLVQVTPAVGLTNAIPLHGGPAIVSAGAEICDFNFPQTCYFASTPWSTIRL